MNNNTYYTKAMHDKNQSLDRGMIYVDDKGRLCEYLETIHTSIVIGCLYKQSRGDGLPLLSHCEYASITYAESKQHKLIKQVDRLTDVLCAAEGARGVQDRFVIERTVKRLQDMGEFTTPA